MLHVVRYPWKLQCYHVVLVGYGPVYLKFSEITNGQYLWKELSDFADFLDVVICILLDIHWSYKNMLFLTGIVRHRLSTNQIVRCFKLKKLENYMTLCKIQKFHVIFWCGNFEERHSFRRVLGASPETLRKLCLSSKFWHLEIRWNFGILRSVRYQVCFLFPLKLQKISCYFGLWFQNTRG